MARQEPLRWDSLRGFNVRDVPQALPPDIAVNCDNVELMSGSLGRRRPAYTLVNLTSGPTSFPRYLFSHYVSTSSTSELWAFSGGASSEVHRRVAGTWSSVTLTDTPVGPATLHPSAASLNDKLFLAYDSAVNRLHVWDGTAVRRVGIEPSNPPGVADTGAGAYAATARNYRIGWRIKVGADVIVASELSTATLFTPSGAGTAARLTRTGVPDSATHWVVYGLIATSGDTYDLYHELAEIAIGTSTYDDSTNPSAYTGDNPAPLGMHIPPPSARYLLSDGNRLLMAGSFETTAAAGETVPRNSRVWYTRVLGSSDIGDDETIPNTSEQKNWIDVGEKDGDRVVALAGPVNGIVYVFKTRSIWQLIPTSNDLTPYVAEVYTRNLGANTPHADLVNGSFNHRNCVMAQTDAGQPVLYFIGSAGAYRLSPASGLEYVGWDMTDPATNNGPAMTSGIWWQSRQQVWWVSYTSSTVVGAIYVFTPRLARLTEVGWRGGWTRYIIPATFIAAWTIAMNDNTLDGALTYPAVGLKASGGGTDGYIAAYSFAGAKDESGGVSFAVSVTSKPFLLGSAWQHVVLDEPILECTGIAVGADNDMIVYFILDHGRETRSVSLSIAESDRRIALPVRGLEGADAYAVQVKALYSEGTNPQPGPLDAITIRYRVQEPR